MRRNCIGTQPKINCFVSHLTKCTLRINLTSIIIAGATEIDILEALLQNPEIAHLTYHCKDKTSSSTTYTGPGSTSLCACRSTRCLFWPIWLSEAGPVCQMPQRRSLLIWTLTCTSTWQKEVSVCLVPARVCHSQCRLCLPCLQSPSEPLRP